MQIDVCIIDITNRDVVVAAGGSMPGGEEDISPYATFHLLGMREEAKNGKNKLKGTDHIFKIQIFFKI